MFKAKPNADGTLERLKARICARGFLQKYGTDFLQTFAPVARLSTIRLQVAISAQLDLKMTHLDFKSAFLQGDLDVPLFMEQPEGLKELMASKGESIGEDCVLRLKKGIYGLKQAGRIWYKSMASGLMALGFTRSPSDTCLFYILNEDKSDIIIITTWVDDCIVSYNNEETWKCMLARICEKVHPGNRHGLRMVPRHGRTPRSPNWHHLPSPVPVRPEPPEEISHGRLQLNQYPC